MALHWRKLVNPQDDKMFLTIENANTCGFEVFRDHGALTVITAMVSACEEPRIINRSGKFTVSTKSYLQSTQ